jgi:putative redox protein
MDRPDTPPRAQALFVHDFGDSEVATRITRALTAVGIAVLSLDATQNVIQAADQLRADNTPASLLIGHGQGGPAVLAAAPEAPEVRAIATIAAPATDETFQGALLRIGDEPGRQGTFIAVDPRLANPADADYAATMLATWAARHAAAPTRQTSTEGEVIVSENGDGQMGQLITVGSHVLTADEPVPVGRDKGPNPYDLLLASLGACTSMTVRMYADRKQWPLEQITVRLRHSRIHATDCADCETKTGILDRIDRTVHLVGDLNEDQRTRLMQIADKCPVHRTLHSEIDIRTMET